MIEMAEKYWEYLSTNDRIKLLKEHKFWEGLCHYHYEFIPEELKQIINNRIESNELDDSKISLF